MGRLQFSEEDEAKFSVVIGKGRLAKTLWFDVRSPLPDADNWPGLGKYPEQPKPRPLMDKSREERQAVASANQAAEDEWKRACEAYRKGRSADPRYKPAVREFVDLQNREPQRRYGGPWWIHKNTVCRLETKEPEALRDVKTDALLIKHYILHRERDYERV